MKSKNPSYNILYLICSWENKIFASNNVFQFFLILLILFPIFQTNIKYWYDIFVEKWIIDCFTVFQFVELLNFFTSFKVSCCRNVFEFLSTLRKDQKLSEPIQFSAVYTPKFSLNKQEFACFFLCWFSEKLCVWIFVFLEIFLILRIACSISLVSSYFR